MHLSAIKRILRYLKGVINFEVLFKRKEKVSLTGWSDSDYVGDTDDRKSTSEYVYMMGIGAISWSSKKHAIVTLSTIEAEFVAATSC
jgi:hypothetical protein